MNRIDSKPNRLNDAQRQLIEANIGLVGYVMQRYGHQGLGFNEDAFQVGLLGLMCAALKYDDTHTSKAKFSSFAVHCIRSALRNERRLQLSARRGGGLEPLSLDTVVLDAEDREVTRLVDTLPSGEPSVEAITEYAVLSQQALHQLEAQGTCAAQIAKAYLLSDDTQREIAERYHVSQVFVNQCVRRTRRMLRKVLGKEGGTI